MRRPRPTRQLSRQKKEYITNNVRIVPSLSTHTTTSTLNPQAAYSQDAAYHSVNNIYVMHSATGRKQTVWREAVVANQMSVWLNN